MIRFYNHEVVYIGNCGWAIRAPDGEVTHEGIPTLEEAVEQVIQDVKPATKFEYRVEWRDSHEGMWMKYCTVLPGQDVEAIKATIARYNDVKNGTEWRMLKRPVQEWSVVE